MGYGVLLPTEPVYYGRTNLTAVTLQSVTPAPTVHGRGRFLLLPVISGAASVLNFLSYVIYPSLWGAAPLRLFTQNNYVGGLYTFIIACSAMPLALYIHKQGTPALLVRYFLVSLCAFVLLLLGVPLLGCSSWGYVCMFSAAGLHLVGVSCAMLVLQGRIARAAVTQLLQPLLFSAALYGAAFAKVALINWVVPFAVSILVASAVSLVFNWGLVKEAAATRLSLVGAGYRAIVVRMLSCLTFSLFF